jgi:hypothetical protein
MLSVMTGLSGRVTGVHAAAGGHGAGTQNQADDHLDDDDGDDGGDEMQDPLVVGHFQCQRDDLVKEYQADDGAGQLQKGADERDSADGNTRPAGNDGQRYTGEGTQ